VCGGGDEVRGVDSRGTRGGGGGGKRAAAGACVRGDGKAWGERDAFLRAGCVMQW